ncbi:MAG: hypothetical protein CBC50_05590 [Synechococcus sp. TMED90]|nr:MAG: hypothetical protein CBC50_05590 [Synechococcus sp. TMED90]
METKERIIQKLESNSDLIYGELIELLAPEKKRFEHWPEQGIYAGTWKVYGLYAFGSKQQQNCENCPITTQVVEAIDGITTAGFSALHPQTHIKPHRGYTNDVLRFHLGLIIPASNYKDDKGSPTEQNTCGLKVNDQRIIWQKGKAFAFDDTQMHEAWNMTKATRYIMILDVLKTSLNE